MSHTTGSDDWSKMLSYKTCFSTLNSMAKEAAEKCYKDSGLRPDDIQVVEVHDCFSCNELMMYEALGLTDNAVR